MSKKPKIYINVKKARLFLENVYGLHTQMINNYHMKVLHEESGNVFNWYFTTGTVVMDTEHNQSNIGIAVTDEDLAMLINKKVLV